MSRARLRVRGVVQGVGFRPLVARLAEERGLGGWVKNDADGVLIEIEGERVDGFADELLARIPPLARVELVEATPVAPVGEARFAIVTSAVGGAARTLAAPDAGPCEACLQEAFDPANRRYRYPFASCTACGPRYTIVRALPYDRARTSMAAFSRCAACEREYRDPRDRRFHAETVACAACGPTLGARLEDLVAALRAGEIVALLDGGGFHLLCDARSELAVARLRARKARDHKPFAVMVASLAGARELAHLSADGEACLASAEHPIVIARRRDDARLADGVAPGLATIGLMLPSSLLGALLFHEAAGRPEGLAWLDAPGALVLVATSANVAGEPILADVREAEARLGSIADRVVGHDREVVAPCDDGVLRVTRAGPVVLRAGRGRAPMPFRVPSSEQVVLGVGASLKDAVALAHDGRAVLSQHVGDLDDARSARFAAQVIAHLERTTGLHPTVVAHDLHPGFVSTRFAEESGCACVAVQHHHAHVAAVLAEHGRAEPTLGLVLDGFGLGTDGQAWGGELLWVEGHRFERVGHLRPLPLPGGDHAAREPWRMAAAVLAELERFDEIAPRFRDEPHAEALSTWLARGAGSVRTTACGRLFDAAAALLGVRTRSRFEAEAPMALEALVDRPEVAADGYALTPSGLDLLPLFERLLELEPRRGAALFHGTLAAGLVAWASAALESRGARTLVLGGGCLQNRVLAELLVEGLVARGVTPLLPRRAPVGDGGLALGQAWVACHHD